MTKSTFSIRRTKTQRKMTYTGDLTEAIQKAKQELDKKQKEGAIQRAHLTWAYERAKKELTAWDNRIDDLKTFIRLAEQQLENEKEDNQ